MNQAVISVQSHVCFGHVGHGAALLPLQRLGIEVHAVPTTLLSNHPRHPSVYGREVDAGLLAQLLQGVEERGAFDSSAGFLSGYLSSGENAEVVAQAVRRYKALNLEGLYCLDPVMGDRKVGFFVREEIPEKVTAELLPLADIVTPNHFEFEVIAGRAVKDLAEMISSARELIAHYALCSVVVTSVEVEQTLEDSLDTLVVTALEAWRFTTPRLPLEASGSGDLFAALFFGHVLRGEGEASALKRTGDAVYGVIAETLKQGGGELAILDVEKGRQGPANKFSISTVKI